MLVAQLAGVPYAQAAGDKSAPKSSPAIAVSDPVLKAMQDEIKRASAELGKMEQPPYYLSYTVYDQDFVVLVGAYGSLLTNAGVQRRFADVKFWRGVWRVRRATWRMFRSEGSPIVPPAASTRLIMEAQTRAEDGMDLLRVETFQAPAASGLPSEAELTGKIEKMAADLSALRKAPVAEPYDGPAVLDGRAAALFFHELLGHTREGPRPPQRSRG